MKVSAHMIKSLDYENLRNFITLKIPCLTVQLMILAVQQQNIKYPVDVQNVKMLGCIHPRYPMKSHQLYADIIPDLAIYKNINNVNVIKKYLFKFWILYNYNEQGNCQREIFFVLYGQDIEHHLFQEYSLVNGEFQPSKISCFTATFHLNLKPCASDS